MSGRAGRPFRGRAPQALATVGAILVLALVLAALPGFAMPIPGTGPRISTGPTPEPLGAAASAPFPTPIRHVIVVMLENQNRASVLAQGPYEASLVARYATDSRYYAICHPSAPNYLALTGGAAYQCGSDAWNVYNATNLGDTLDAVHRTWAGFDESMPTPCDTANAGVYAVKHNPFVYYRDIESTSSRCDAHDLPLAAWTNDVANGTVPNFALITPNLTDDGHNTNVSYADAWLRGWLSPLQNDSFFASSVVFVTYDESSSNDGGGYNGTQGGNVYLAAVSPYARSGYDLATNASHYNLLATVEWLLGAPGTGQNDSSPGFPAMKGLFSFPTSTYEVVGDAVSATTDLGIPGATVRVTGEANHTTNATGAFSYTLPNGSYGLAIVATGYAPFSTTFTVNGTSLELNESLVPSKAPTYALRGYVKSVGTNAVVPNANVSLSTGSSTVTTSEGRYVFNVANGTYRVNVTASGFLADAAAATVNGAPAWANFTVTPVPISTFLVRGNVTSSADGRPIANAVIAAGTNASNTTDLQGAFVLALPNGTYRLAAVASGYLGNLTTVTVAGQPTTVNFHLAPAPTVPPASVPPRFPITTAEAEVLGLVAAAVVVTAGVAVALRRRRPS